MQNNKTNIVIHSPYTINIARSNSHINTLLHELEIANYIGAIGCVVHSGKYTNNTIEDATEYMYKSLKYVIDKIIQYKWNVKLILELMTGSGTDILVTSKNLDKVQQFYNRFDNLEKQYLKICIDTCHLFSSGYDISNKSGILRLLREIKEKIGFENIGLIHLNDSIHELGSKKDRHQDIGYGKIGKNNILYFLKKILKYKIPIILETKNPLKDLVLIK